MATAGGVRFGEGTVLDSPIADAEVFVHEVVALVSNRTGEEPLELPPLADAIDPEAVQQVLQSSAARSTQVSFRYAGCDVVVTGDGELLVLERSDEYS